MNRIISFLSLVILVVMIGLGVSVHVGTSIPAKAQPQVIERVLDPTLEPFANMWQKEINRRFDNAVMILVHGGDFVEDQWIVGDWQYRSGVHVRPIKDVVAETQKMYPGRTIVLLACNPGHLNLGIPGVYYAKSSVWCIPDRDMDQATPSMSTMTLNDTKPMSRAYINLGRWDEDPDVVGNIFEFVSE